MNREPVNIEFVLRGDIEKEIEKVALSVRSLGTQGTVSYRNLLNSSNEAFNALSKDSQAQAVALQKVITQIRQSEEAHDALKKKYEDGEISATQFAEAAARLSVQQAEFKATAAGLSAQLQREIQINKEVEGSYNQKILRLKELKETYAQLSAEEVNNAEIGGKMIQTIQQLEGETKKFEQTLAQTKTAASDSIDGMRSKLSELEKSYNSLSQAERNSKSGRALSAQMRALRGDIETAENANRSFIEQMKAAPGPIGSTVSGIEAMTKAALRFIATPLGIVIATIVLALKALFTWFKRTEEGQVALASASGYWKGILEGLLDVVSRLGEALYKAFNKPKEALDDLADFMKGKLVNRLTALVKFAQSMTKIISNPSLAILDMNNAIAQLFTGVEDAGYRWLVLGSKINKKATENSEIERKLINLRIESRKINEEIAASEAKIAEYREKAYDTTISEGERLNAINKASKLIDENFNKQIEHKKKELELIEAQTDLYDTNIEQNEEISRRKVEILNLEARRQNEQRALNRQQNMLVRAVENEKTAQELLEEELKKKKEAYQLYYRFITATSKETAQGMFSDLVKEGDSYLEYINRKISELQGKPTLTKDETTQLTVYTSEKQELTGSGSAVDILKREIDAKKKLYDEDIIAFRQYLQEKKKALTEDQSEEGYKQTVLIEVELQAADDAYKNKLDDLMKRYGSYTTQMVSLTRDYQRDKAILEKAGTQEARDAIQNLTNEYNNAVLQLKNGSDNFLQAIFGDIERMGYQALKKLKDQAKSVIDSAQESTTNGQTFVIVDVESVNEQGQVIKRQVKLTIEEFQRLQKQYNELYDAMESKNPFANIAESFNNAVTAIQTGDKEGLSSAIDAFSMSVDQGIGLVNQWGDSLGQIFGQDTSDNVKFLTDMVKGMKDLGTGIAQLASGDIIGGITNTLKGAAEIYTTLTAGAKKYKEDQKKWMNELIRLQLDYNSVLNEQLRIQEQSNVFITDYVRNIQNAFTALSDAQGNMDDLLGGKSMDKFLSELEFKVGVAKKKFLGITTGSKSIYGELGDNWAKLGLSGSISDLVDDAGNLNVELAKTLLAIDGIKDETKNSLEEIISYQEQINASFEAINSAIESIAGSVGSDLYNALRQSWDAGTDSFEAFKDSVSSGIKDIVSQLIFNEIFADQFDALQENLKKSFSLAGDQSVLDDFTTFLDSSPASLTAWEQAMRDFEDAARDAGFEVDNLNESLTGSTADSIQDAISQGFENGYRSASDFANTFKDLMKKAVLEAMKLQVLEQPLKEWYSQFSESMKSDTLAENMTSLNESFNAIIEQAAEYIKGLESSTGLDFVNVSQTADKNSIKSITEETGSKLEGHFVAVRINTGKLVESAESILALTAKNQLHLAAIEKNTNELSRLESIETVMKRIESNGLKMK
jgi:hypothetical protein